MIAILFKLKACTVLGEVNWKVSIVLSICRCFYGQQWIDYDDVFIFSKCNWLFNGQKLY